jgi:septal ring factor EnvC (AmiA/AmiB activator)
LILDDGRAAPVVDVDSALLSVKERDNWRRRMELLERSLADVRDRRRRLETRLRRLRRDLGRLRDAAEATVRNLASSPSMEIAHAAPSASIHHR